ncbi:MAG: protein-L-isoaspartate O-methyltransferase [Gammaproteobacteria bacterium]|nr:protein-L-isoaspartate O-methyltransferase [Gammaproteobacteria bacterium]
MGNLNLIQARQNMVEQQIRPWDVLDQEVLSLLDQIPRDEFVPDNYKNLAYADMRIPLGHGQFMLEPKVEARILQALVVDAGDKVLEVGTGSGYMTALLAAQAEQVYSVEIHPELQAQAKQRLASHDITNVTLESGDAARAWDAHAPYDAIVITGSMPVLPERYRQSLAVGGRLFVIVGDSPAMEAHVITRLGQDEFTDEVLFETDLPPLENAEQPERFIL